jgi:predicted MPP superfamily phosphohydrolase
MWTRRGVLGGLAVTIAAGTAVAVQGFGLEPYARAKVVRYRVPLRGLAPDARIRIAVLADVHAGEPGFPVSRVRETVEATNALAPDLICLLGDYCGGAGARQRLEPPVFAAAVASLRAPLGRYAVFGNHDYWDGIMPFRTAFTAAGIPILENARVKLGTGPSAFWLAGVASTIAIPLGERRYEGLDDLPGTLEHITDTAPIILLAHEPDIFPRVPPRVGLTISGHTHGGQVRLFGWSPIVPSDYGNRYAYGHVVENGRHLVVSGGLGTSIMPVRLGVPPEITLIEVTGAV